MTIEDFEVLSRARFDHCIELMIQQKHKEYSRNNDKLYNFKRAGEILRCTPFKALLGMFSKHLVSIIDIVEDIDKGIMPSQEMLDSKIGDAINYHVLLEALIIERIKNQEQEVSNGGS